MDVLFNGGKSGKAVRRKGQELTEMTYNLLLSVDRLVFETRALAGLNRGWATRGFDSTCAVRRVTMLLDTSTTEGAVATMNFSVSEDVKEQFDEGN